MKAEIIILILNIYHTWNTMESERTETIVIHNDERADLNAQNLISMFIREVLEIEYLPDADAARVSEYTITNEEIDIPIDRPSGEWLVTVSAEYSDIKPYNNRIKKDNTMSVEVYQRVVDEHEELYAKYEALQKMLDKPQPNFISDRQWKLLKKQEKHMRKYNRILAKRVEDLYDENYAELETKTLLG